ncbi:MAG: hypothetical protein JW719_14560 [Pirellulales bacterium]|nr:hypothetical protein [Pirellulales bacterium]
MRGSNDSTAPFAVGRWIRGLVGVGFLAISLSGCASMGDYAPGETGLFGPRTKSNRIETVTDFVGAERPQ